MKIQPILLQAFASTPVRVAEPQGVSATGARASCEQTNGAAQQAKTAQPVDELDLSTEAVAAADREEANRPQPPNDAAETGRTDSPSDIEPTTETAEGHNLQVDAERSEADEASVADDLTEEEQQQVAQLRSRDREVRAHEQAHLAAAGPYATGGPSFSYQKGPDGQRYAVGGEVGIDTSAVSGDPEATIQKAQQIRAAALAPASPSGQDQQVAAAATQMAAQARAELAKQNQSKSPAATSYEEAEEEDLMGTLLDLVA